jgi:hypothetical protein
MSNLDQPNSLADHIKEAFAKKKTRTVILTLFVLAIPAWALFSTPGSIAFNSDGEVVEIEDRVRAWVQGSSFWDGQVLVVEAAIQERKEYPKKIEEGRLKKDKIAAIKRKKLENLYQQRPELRPSPTQQAAYALRQKAEEAESKDGIAVVEAINIKHIEKLQILLKLAKSKR